MFTRQGGGVWQAQSAFWLATPRKEETLVCVAPCKYSTEERCSGLSLGPVHCFSVQCSLRSATAYMQAWYDTVLQLQPVGQHTFN